MMEKLVIWSCVGSYHLPIELEKDILEANQSNQPRKIAAQIEITPLESYIILRYKKLEEIK